MSFTEEEIVAKLGSLTVMQLIGLTRDLESKWGVEAKPIFTQSTAVPQQEAQGPVQTEFDVVFTSFPPDKKMGLIKLVRELLGLGLLDSKTLVESLPKTLKEGLSKEDAEAMKAKLVEAGGIIEIK